jgi:hypothetical protein
VTGIVSTAATMRDRSKRLATRSLRPSISPTLLAFLLTPVHEGQVVHQHRTDAAAFGLWPVMLRSLVTPLTAFLGAASQARATARTNERRFARRQRTGGDGTVRHAVNGHADRRREQPGLATQE